MPPTMAALLLISACDDEEEKRKVVDVAIDKCTELRVKVKEKDSNEMIVFGELALFVVVIAWALFGAGATRRRSEQVSEDG